MMQRVCLGCNTGLVKDKLIVKFTFSWISFWRGLLIWNTLNSNKIHSFTQTVIFRTFLTPCQSFCSVVKLFSQQFAGSDWKKTQVDHVTLLYLSPSVLCESAVDTDVTRISWWVTEGAWKTLVFARLKVCAMVVSELYGGWCRETLCTQRGKIKSTIFLHAFAEIKCFRPLWKNQQSLLHFLALALCASSLFFLLSTAFYRGRCWCDIKN